MSRVTTRPRPRPASSWKKSGPMLLLIIAGLGLGWPRPGIAETSPGAVILVGDVLPFNQRNVWNRIVEHAPELVIVAAASDRPKLYGEFARRALERHGAFAELLPVAVDAAEFGIDPRRAGEDPALVEQVRDAAGVFFVGGAPQRLAGALFRADGTQTPLASAIVDLHAEGGAVVGGIPGPAGLSTGVDALEALAGGRVPPAQLFRGLGLMTDGWFVDQHVFSPGRFAEMLVAMHQLGIPRGIGVGTETSAVIEDGRGEVVGDGGVLLIDLSRGLAASSSADGFQLEGARLSYLEHGDRFDMSTLEVTPAAAKLDGFELEPSGGAPEPSTHARPAAGDAPESVAQDRSAAGDAPESAKHDHPAAGDLLAVGELLRLLREAIDGPGPEASGYAFPAGEGGARRGFRFRFHSLDDTRGWLSVHSGADRYTIVNVGLDISVVGQDGEPIR